MPSWDFSESLLNVFTSILSRAMYPIPESKKAELSDLLETEKDHADAHGNKLVEVLMRKRELDKILNDVEIRRRHIDELEG